jgi:gamma-glutamyltranspeptidase/glutathione hydrolase
MSSPAFASRRSPVYGRAGMVAASQPLATAAGIEILRQGGNAADAAVAVAAALNVTEPTSTGIGGDMFALFFDGRAKQVSALNGSGRAPGALTLERLQQEGLKEIPPYHPYTVTVPGACAGWCDLVQRHGILSMGQILAPAIRLAEEGFPVTPITSYFWRRGVERQLRFAPNGDELMLDGRAPMPGEIFMNPGLARTFKQVAEGGKRAFYEGEIARAITAVVKQAGGCLAVADLATHASTWETPLSVSYRTYRVFECPPNGQGLTTLLALNLLEGFDLASLAPLEEERLHLEIEALRLAFADARWYVSDPEFVKPSDGNLSISELISKAYADERRKLIDPRRATLNQPRGAPAAASDTVYLSVIDAVGNACSLINSNYMGFGTGIVPRGWGFPLQNRGHSFNMDADHPNVLAPGKRPYHTIIPALATRSGDGSLFASFGVMGGFMQPQGHVQIFTDLVDSGLDPQTALDLPRFCIEDGNPNGCVAVEDGMDQATATGLSQRGHSITAIAGWERALFGRGQIIMRDPGTGVLTGGSDPRADGCAMSLV